MPRCIKVEAFVVQSSWRNYMMKWILVEIMSCIIIHSWCQVKICNRTSHFNSLITHKRIQLMICALSNSFRIFFFNKLLMPFFNVFMTPYLSSVAIQRLRQPKVRNRLFDAILFHLLIIINNLLYFGYYKKI